MTEVEVRDGATIGHYSNGDWSNLPGKLHDQRRTGGDFRIALKSMIRGTLARSGKEAVFTNTDVDGEFTVTAEPPFETTEAAAEVGQALDQKWQAQLERAKIGSTVLSHIDSFTPVAIESSPAEPSVLL